MHITANPRRAAGALALLALPAVAAAGCGGSSQAASPAKAPATTAAARTSSAPAAGHAIDVTATEFAFAPAAAEAAAGKVRITLDNQGKIPHELVVLKTSKAAGSLPASGGRVDEATSVGEVPEIAAGASKSATLNLKPGRYVMICNIPGHYAGGMRGTLTVK